MGMKDLEVLNEDERKFKGFVSVEVADKEGEIIPIDELAKHMDTLMDTAPNINDEHSNVTVGRILNWQRKKHPRTGADSVEITAKIFNNRHYEIDDKVWNGIKEGGEDGYNGLSFGGSNKEKEFKNVGGRPVQVLTDLEAYEISVCRSPCNAEAVITGFNPLAKSDNVLQKKEDDVIKAYETVSKPFAGFSSFSDCLAEMKDKGYPLENSKRICGYLQSRYENKSRDETVKDLKKQIKNDDRMTDGERGE